MNPVRRGTGEREARAARRVGKIAQKRTYTRSIDAARNVVVKRRRASDGSEFLSWARQERTVCKTESESDLATSGTREHGFAANAGRTDGRTDE